MQKITNKLGILILIDYEKSARKGKTYSSLLSKDVKEYINRKIG